MLLANLTPVSTAGSISTRLDTASIASYAASPMADDIPEPGMAGLFALGVAGEAIDRHGRRPQA